MDDSSWVAKIDLCFDYAALKDTKCTNCFKGTVKS